MLLRYIIITASLLIVGTAHAATYCEWDGANAINCRVESKGVLKLDSGLIVSGGEANYNSHGYYLLVDAQPVYDKKTQKLVPLPTTFSANTIVRNYSVVLLNPAEINAIDAELISMELYQFMRFLVIGPKIIKQADIDAGPEWLKKGYNARVALGQ